MSKEKRLIDIHTEIHERYIKISKEFDPSYALDKACEDLASKEYELITYGKITNELSKKVDEFKQLYFDSLKKIDTLQNRIFHVGLTYLGIGLFIGLCLFAVSSY